MASGYFAALKLIPWDEIVRNAPRIIEASKALWGKVGAAAEPAGATLDDRLAALETQVSELRQELRASAELIEALANQNAQLVQTVAVLRRRTQILLGAVALLGLGFVAALIGYFSR
jgi:hypothetical protein